MPLISVIVAVYQSENTLERCLDSILSQTLRDIEVILVNDGSTDKSAEICNAYAKKDMRVKFFEKQHSGVSDTRQVGLDNVTGEFVIHCDSDDWMEPEMLRFLYDKAKGDGSDMVVCDYLLHENSRVKKYRQFPLGIIPCLSIEKQLDFLSSTLWNKLVRFSLFETLRLKFPLGLTMAEDVYVVMLLLNSHIKISYVPYTLYHYDHYTNTSHVTAVYDRKDIDSNKYVFSVLSEVLSPMLCHRLKPIKRGVLINAYKNKIYSRDELVKLFPDVHGSIVVLSLIKWRLFPLSLLLVKSRVSKLF